MLDLWSEKLLATPYYTFTINPTPSNATVTINGVNTKSVTVEEGTTITWSVSASGYASQSGSFVLEDDTTKNVTLTQMFTFTINPTPSTATVMINGKNTKSVTVAKGTAITWSVSATNYVTQSGSLTLTANTTKNVTLASSLKYACYRQTSYVPNLYYYAKVPLGSDTVVYYNTASASAPASSSSNLGATPYTWTSLSESQAVQSLTPGITFTRYTAGDLYS